MFNLNYETSENDMQAEQISDSIYEERFNKFMEMQQYRTAYSPKLGEPVEIHNIELTESGSIYVNVMYEDRRKVFSDSELTNYEV